MLNKRKSRRRKMVLPVKVSVDKVTHLAHTVDISTTGAQLGGLRTQLQPGMIISLQRGSKKAEYSAFFDPRCKLMIIPGCNCVRRPPSCAPVVEMSTVCAR